MSPQNTTLAKTPVTTLEPGRPLEPVVAGLLTTVDAVTARMQEMTRVATVLSPWGQRPSHLAEGFAVSMAVVTLEPDVDQYGNGAETYRGSFMKADQRAPNKVGLRKLSNALGIEWLPQNCGRVDDGRRPHVCRFAVTGVYRTFDGAVQNLTGTAEIDFSDGSEQIGGWTPAAWAELMTKNKAALSAGSKKDELDWSVGGWSEQRVRAARQKVVERAETAAKNRAIRDIGLRHVYTLAELRKPFVCFRMTYVPDMSDPEIKRLVTMNNLSGLAMLYPQLALNPAPVAQGPDVDAAQDVPAKGGEPGAPASDSGHAEPSTPAEPARRARTVIKVDSHQAGGASVVLDGGELCRADDTLAGAAASVCTSGRPVFVALETRAGEAWIVEMEYAGQAPSTPVPPPAGETVADIVERKGEGARGPWTLRKITTSAGKLLTTFSDELAATAERARVGKLPIRYTAEPSEKYAGQLELKALRIDDGTEPDLPFDREDKY
jgi:hypothetical protein